MSVVPYYLWCTRSKQRAWQAVPDDLLGEPSGFDEPVEVDAGRYAKLFAEEHELFRCNVAGSSGLPGKGASTQAGHGGIELRYVQPQTLIGRCDRVPVYRGDAETAPSPASAHGSP